MLYEAACVFCDSWGGFETVWKDKYVRQITVCAARLLPARAQEVLARWRTLAVSSCTWSYT